MKKLLTFLLSVVLLFKITALPAFAEEDNATYHRTEPQKVANHLLETKYTDWNSDKAAFIGALLAKMDYTDIAPGVMTEEEFNALYKTYFFTNPDSIKFYEAVLDAYERAEIMTGKTYLYCESICEAYNNEFRELYDALTEYWDEIIEAFSLPLCTSCRTGNLIGRNFDWVYDDVDEFIMRVPAIEGERHASIGVASGFFSPEIQKSIGIEDILPMLTMDGINDAGVAINVNVVASSDVPKLLGVVGVEDYDLAYTSGTNPGAEKDICAGFVVRYVLDNANSAENAIKLLKDINIYSIDTQEFHWMISDNIATYIVECVNNQLVVLKTKNTGNPQAAMSNFHVSNSQHLNEYDVDYPSDTTGLVSEDYTKLPMGIERYETVKNGLSEMNDADDMLANMQKVWYKKQLFEEGNIGFWSDMNMHTYKNGDNTLMLQYGDEEDPIAREARIQEFESNKEKYRKAREREKEYGQRVVDGQASGVIQTVHTGIYDLDQKTLMVNVQERKTPFCFALEDEANANRTEVFVNGDNVGLATLCDVEGEEWIYNPETKTIELKHCKAYNIEGLEGSDITVNQPEHQWDGGHEITPSTSDHDGIKLFTCKQCGATKTEMIPKTGTKGVKADKANTNTGIMENNASSMFTVALLLVAAAVITAVAVVLLKKKRN